MDETSVDETPVPPAPPAVDGTAPDAAAATDAGATSTPGTPTEAASADQATGASQTATDGTEAGLGTPTDAAATTETDLGPDPLAQMEDDQSAFVLGALPLILIVAFGIAAVVFYMVRRKKNWNELDDALKIDGGDTPVGNDEAFTTRDLQEMEPTRPSQRMSELND